MTTADIERLEALAMAGVLLTQAARALGRRPATVRLWATRYGIVFRQRGWLRAPSTLCRGPGQGGPGAGRTASADGAAAAQMTCDACDAPAMVILPGQDEVRGLATILLARAIPRRCLCLEHAKAAGFPWIQGETPKRKPVQT